jgi:cell division protein FtsB
VRARKGFFLTLAIVALLIFLMFVIYGKKGLMDVHALRQQRDRLVKKNEILNRENLVLYREIDRLKHDPIYIETIARQELGLIGKDELIFKFREQKEAKK